MGFNLFASVLPLAFEFDDSVISLRHKTLCPLLARWSCSEVLEECSSVSSVTRPWGSLVLPAEL